MAKMVCPTCQTVRVVPVSSDPVECHACPGMAYPPGHPALQTKATAAPEAADIFPDVCPGDYITTTQAASMAGITVRTLRRLVERGHIPTPPTIGKGFAWTLSDVRLIHDLRTERENN